MRARKRYETYEITDINSIDFFHTGNLVEGDLSPRDRRLAPSSPETVKNLSSLSQTVVISEIEA
jgi:hypothetical protein